jgi:hypothetical protein
MDKCRLYYDRPAHSLKEIKDKLNTKVRGDVFEHFAIKYLTHAYAVKFDSSRNAVSEEAGLSTRSDKFSDIWLLCDVPADILEKLQLKRYDQGIDIICRDTAGRFYAVQAKYRKRNLQKAKIAIGWRELSTFYALTTRSGPYVRHIIITNADYVRHVGRKNAKDQSICYRTLCNTTKEKWQLMSGIKGQCIDDERDDEGDERDDEGDDKQDENQEEKGEDDEEEEEEENHKKKDVEPYVDDDEPPMKVLTVEDVRAKRLAYFNARKE